jgi:ParB-like chromosome segregation protein Spo0J
MKPSHIAPPLAGLAVPIGSVKPHPRNARHGDIGAITESLKRFGQQKPIVVQDSSGFVVAGNHLLRSAIALGWSEVAVNRVKMTDAEAKAFMVADNRTADLGTYDESLLTELLSEIASSSSLAGTGYDQGDLDERMAQADWKASGGNPVVMYALIFDDEAQQAAWQDWLKKLRRRYPEAANETHAFRINLAIAADK